MDTSIDKDSIIEEEGGDENASTRRSIRSEDSSAERVSGTSGGVEKTGVAVREREQTEAVRQSEKEQGGTGNVPGTEGQKVPESSPKHDNSRDMGERGVEYGDKGSDTGIRERLATTEPRDIVLHSGSDIGASKSAAVRFDANLEAIKTLKAIESEDRRATPEEQKVLAQYSGFGDVGMNAAFEHYHGRETESWKQRNETLKEITTKTGGCYEQTEG